MKYNKHSCPKCSKWEYGITGSNYVKVEMEIEIEDDKGKYQPYVCPKCGLTEWYKEDS